MEITLGKQNKKSDFSDTEMEVILSGIEKNTKKPKKHFSETRGFTKS